MTLDDIGQLLAWRGKGAQRCTYIRELVGKKLGAVDEQLRALRAFRNELTALRAEANATTCANGELCGIIEQHELIHDSTDVSKASRPLARGR